jgi:N-acetylglucosaminyldiphosphoundecaprenol N-acetyl-beta-D-mannosaminyltransferase
MIEEPLQETLLESSTMPVALATAAEHGEDRLLTILGVHLTDVARPRAIMLLSEMLEGYKGRTRAVFFVNAHTLNLAAGNEEYRQVLNAGDYVFGDGTGVRWAARLQKAPVRDNLCGTDLIPQLMQATSRRGYRYYLLGGDEATIEAAAEHAKRTMSGWTLVGHHHGYVQGEQASRAAVEAINQAGPDLLLVGMGNPLQEQWINAHRRQLRVPLCAGIGGLFHYWAGDLQRAPAWLRRMGAEWLGILCQQPHKAKRYLLGNPLFLWRILRESLSATR